jgi:hypothetical protein
VLLRFETPRGREFEKYSKHPHDVHLAPEIKTIDDEIAECAQKMDRRGLTAPVPAVKK